MKPDAPIGSLKLHLCSGQSSNTLLLLDVGQSKCPVLKSHLSVFVSGLYKKSGTLVFLGLGNAGKTTLLLMLNDHRLGLHVPTFDPSKCIFHHTYPHEYQT